MTEPKLKPKLKPKHEDTVYYGLRPDEMLISDDGAVTTVEELRTGIKP